MAARNSKTEKGEWKTINGVHVFIREGESATDAINRAIAKKNEDTKATQIAKNKVKADQLNGKTKKTTSKAPTRSGLFWSNDDIDKAIHWLRENKEVQKELLDNIPSGRDKSAIAGILKDGYAEQFDRYDSEVGEKFLRVYESVISNSSKKS